jgi:uncharacterized protein (DUF433 family)
MQSTESVIHSDPDILGGTPVFVGTRVPLQNLIDYLSAGTVSRISSARSPR